MKSLRSALIALSVLLIAALFGTQIKALEAIKKNGETVLLELRPVDPRALMMGDFMALRYAEEMPDGLPEDIMPKGVFVLRKDENDVGTFARLDSWEDLAENEIMINYIKRRRGVTFGAPRYYFQNGTAKSYEPAEYGLFKVSPEGRAVLVALVDKDFTIISPPKD